MSLSGFGDCEQHSLLTNIVFFYFEIYPFVEVGLRQKNNKSSHSQTHLCSPQFVSNGGWGQVLYFSCGVWAEGMWCVFGVHKVNK